MGLHSFLRHTDLPTYFPLSNISGSSFHLSSVMNLLNEGVEFGATIDHLNTDPTRKVFVLIKELNSFIGWMVTLLLIKQG